MAITRLADGQATPFTLNIIFVPDLGEIVEGDAASTVALVSPVFAVLDRTLLLAIGEFLARALALSVLTGGPLGLARL